MISHKYEAWKRFSGYIILQHLFTAVLFTLHKQKLEFNILQT